MRLIDVDKLRIHYGLAEDCEMTAEESYWEKKAHLYEDAIIILSNAIQQKWTPCSERLPEHKGIYLVTNTTWGYHERSIAEWTGVAWRTGGKPSAWMPLPPPYKETE